MLQKIPVIHRLNDDYALPAAVAMHSMLRRANPDFFYDLHVLHSDITAAHQEGLLRTVNAFPNAALTFLTPDENTTIAEVFARTKNKGHFSAEALWTLLLADVLPDVDRCIATDVDVLWMGDIAEIWEAAWQASPHDWRIAGVPGLAPISLTWLSNYYERYRHDFNDEEVRTVASGVGGGLLVLQLDRLREVEMSRRFLDYASENAYRLRQLEQDVINLVAHDDILHLPLRHMVCTYFYEMQSNGELAAGDARWSPSEIDQALREPIQLHFAGNGRRKPWINPEALFGARWIEELAQTEFLQEWLTLYSQRRLRATQRRLWSVPVPFRERRRLSVIWESPAQ